MTDHSVRDISREGAKQDFLVHEPRRSYDGSHRLGEPVGAEAGPHYAAVSRVFADTGFGDSFLDAACERMKRHRVFAVAAIQPDAVLHDQCACEAHLLPEIFIDLAGAIERLCGTDTCIWGMATENLFGCFFPDITADGAMAIIQRLRGQPAAEGVKTFTAGIAEYPTINYTMRDIFENARKAIDHAAFFGPASAVCFDAVTLNISGDRRYQEKDIRGAIEEYTAALKLDPSNVNVHNSLGVCHGIAGNHPEALASFETAMRLDGKEVMAVYNTGLIYLQMGDADAALKYFLRADALDSGVYEVAFQIGKWYLDRKDPEAAREYLKRAVALRPDLAAAYTLLGECEAAAGAGDRAIAAYKKAVQLNPNDAAALSGLGWLLDLQGENIEVATVFCRQSTDLAPGNPLYGYRLARLYYKQ